MSKKKKDVSIFDPTNPKTRERAPRELVEREDWIAAGRPAVKTESLIPGTSVPGIWEEVTTSVDGVDVYTIALLVHEEKIASTEQFRELLVHTEYGRDKVTAASSNADRAVAEFAARGFRFATANNIRGDMRYSGSVEGLCAKATRTGIIPETLRRMHRHGKVSDAVIAATEAYVAALRASGTYGAA